MARHVRAGGSAWLPQALHTNGPAVTWRGTDAATHQPAVVITAPVKSGGKPVGIVALFEHMPEAGQALAANVGNARHPSFTVVDVGSRHVVTSSLAGGERGGRLYGSADIPGSGLRVYAGVRRSVVLAGARGALTRQALAGIGALL